MRTRKIWISNQKKNCQWTKKRTRTRTKKMLKIRLVEEAVVSVSCFGILQLLQPL